MGRAGRFGGLFVLVLAASGCGGSMTVGALVQHPAEIPLRAFPRVVLLPGVGPYDREVADALGLHLASTGLVDVHVAAAGSEVGRGAPGTAVVRLDVTLTTSSRTDWVRHPETVCGAMGCYSAARTVPVHMPVTEARLSIVVIDSSNGRPLQESALLARHAASRRQVDRAVVADLSDQLRRAVDGRRERVEVKLLAVRHPSVRRALGLLREGNWSEGREALESFVSSGEVAALAEAQRARVYYDLGIARRFDPSSVDARDPEPHFRRARDAFERAVELDAEESRYVAALAALEAHRQRVSILHEQRRALDHNRRLAAQPAPAVAEEPALGSPGEAVTTIPIPENYAR